MKDIAKELKFAFKKELLKTIEHHQIENAAFKKILTDYNNSLVSQFDKGGAFASLLEEFYPSHEDIKELEEEVDNLTFEISELEDKESEAYKKIEKLTDENERLLERIKGEE